MDAKAFVSPIHIVRENYSNVVVHKREWEVTHAHISSNQLALWTYLRKTVDAKAFISPIHIVRENYSHGVVHKLEWDVTHAHISSDKLALWTHLKKTVEAKAFISQIHINLSISHNLLTNCRKSVYSTDFLLVFSTFLINILLNVNKFMLCLNIYNYTFT